MPPLSEPQVLHIGQRVEIGLDRADAMLWYRSRLESDTDAEQVVLAWPTDRERRLVTLWPGQPIQVAITAQDALYVASALVEGTEPAHLPLLRVRLAGAWQRAQRRRNVRTSVAIRPRQAARLMGPDAAEQPLRLGITNLSAGGLQVRSQDALQPGDRLVITFDLMGIETVLEVRARVQRVERQDRGALAIWDAGCAFEDLPARTAEQIVQFIFAQQRALARARRSHP